MNDLFSKMKEKISKISPPLKWGILAVLISVILISAVYFFRPETYQTLYAGLSETDNIEVQQYLSRKGIDFKVEGESILVNGNVPLIKSELASLGLPSNPEKVGLTKFDELSLGSTQFDKEVQYQDRLREDLENSIVHAFEEVEKAKVILPKLEEQSIFENERKTTNISVAVKLKPGKEITPENVNAIQLFVASSIQDITPEEVEVLDSNMSVLSNNKEDSLSYDTSKSMEITNETKQRIEEDLERVLGEVYGRVNVIARVDIDFDEIVQNIETYDPEGTLVSREQSVERERSVQGEVEGIVGTDANGEVPGYEVENLDEEDATYLRDKENLIENFEVGKTVEKIIHHPELRNVNVVVWVDGNDLIEEQINDLEGMVALSAGLTGEGERNQNNTLVFENGSVKVTQIEFAEQRDLFEEEEDLSQASIPWWVWAASGAAILFIVALLFVLLRKKKKKEEPVFEIEKEREEKQEVIEENTENVKEKDINEKESEEYEELKEKFEFQWTEERKNLRNLTNEVTRKYPKETAEVIKRMLNK